MDILLIIKFIAPFIIRQIDKFGHNIDWAKVEADANARIRKLVPGELFDDLAVTLFGKVLSTAKTFVQDEVEMQKLVDLCVAKQFKAAIQELEAYLLAQLTA